MKKSFYFLGSGLLIAGTFAMMLNTVDAESATIDLQVKKLETIQSTASDGQPIISVVAFWQNTGSAAAENCDVTIKINNKEVSKKTYTKIEKDYLYVLEGLYPAEAKSGKNTILLSVCPTISGEKNSRNNEKTAYVNAKIQTGTVVGASNDLKLKNYEVAAVKNDKNKDSIFTSIIINNGGNNASGSFKVAQTVNNGTKSLFPFESLPGRSSYRFTLITDTSTFVEGINLLELLIDSDAQVVESNEKNNASYYLATIEDGTVSRMRKINERPDFLVQGLFYVNPLLLDPSVYSGSSGMGSAVSVPVLNVGQAYTASGNQLTLQIEQNKAVYTQNYNITDWTLGGKKVFNFTNRLFKKKELSRPMKVNILWNGKKIYGENLKVKCF